MLKKLFLPLFALTLLGGAFLASNPTYAGSCDQYINIPQAYSECIRAHPDEYGTANTSYEEKYNQYNCGSFTTTQLYNCSKIGDGAISARCAQCKALKDAGYNGPNGNWLPDYKNVSAVKKQCEEDFNSLPPAQRQVYTNDYASGAEKSWFRSCYKKYGLNDTQVNAALDDKYPVAPGGGTQDPPDGTSGSEKQEQPVWDEMSGKENYYVPNTAPTVKSECRPFLGLVSWDCNTEFQDVSDEEDISRVVVMIAINIFTDITVLASYLVIGYIIYGGYLYIFANGDVGKVSTGKKALNQAFIGLAITLSAHIIVNAIRVAFMHNNGSFEACATGECVDADTLISGLIQWVVGIGGAVAAVFVVGGGIMYMTSAGDPNKLQLAKNIIKYALIGLVIVALAEIITGFMTNVIVNAKNSSGSGEETSYINNIKEYYENQKVS